MQTPHNSLKNPSCQGREGFKGKLRDDETRILTYPLSFSASLDCVKESIQLRLLFQKRIQLSMTFP
ncbi:hypothetical protein C6371_07255 [Bacillus atrophaeus]|nr:hypothetical protein C6371_07255 [Bacillus atrophaeus]